MTTQEVKVIADILELLIEKAIIDTEDTDPIVVRLLEARHKLHNMKEPKCE